MDIELSIRIDGVFMQMTEYDGAVPIPNVGEDIVNPQTDGLVVKVQRRIFEYRPGVIRITLDC
jgi:hypothetical protein